MMATTHAASGAVAWLAVYPVLDAVATFTPGQALVGFGLTAGAACLPDLDQGGVTWKKRGIVRVPVIHGSAVARTYGWLTAAAAWTIHKAAGGHRQGTHSYVGTAAFTGVAALCWLIGSWPLAVAVWLILGVAFRVVDYAMRTPWPGAISLIHALLMAGVTLIVVQTVDVGPVLPLATVIGCLAHIAGDCCTEERCPLHWPFSRRRFGFGLVKTNSNTEHGTILPWLVIVATVLALWDTGSITTAVELWRANA
jgi:membrane-bound metal-dependent hydrolase YbcI (DUF457 family)